MRWIIINTKYGTLGIVYKVKDLQRSSIEEEEEEHGLHCFFVERPGDSSGNLEQGPGVQLPLAGFGGPLAQSKIQPCCVHTSIKLYIVVSTCDFKQLISTSCFIH